MIDLERQCPGAAHWSHQQYQQLLNRGGGPERLVLVAEVAPAINPASAGLPSADSSADLAENGPSEMLGFLVAAHVAHEWELESIVVSPPARRNRLGTRLLNAFLDRARATNSEAVFLEVRASNAPARNLYETAGFEQTGRRHGYYPDPPEDAILYRRRLGQRTVSY
ncbi:MAG TPA: GNAT family N-acetyltransferase [Terriglobales bacterium]|nr:GNAT family N-acetyltransferase [Terriglobales bacterium]